MGSLQQSVKFWEDIGASGTVLDWIRYGVPLRWRSRPVRDGVLRNSESAMEHASFVDMALAELLAAGAVRHTSIRPAVVSPLGVVPKPNSKDKFRLIVNMRYVNQAIVVPKFRMETLSSLADLLKSQDFMVSFDLKSGFWHIPLAPDAQQYVAFSWRGQYYCFCRLPFGLASSPWAFTKVLRQLVKYWRGLGIRLLPYLDDFLFMSRSREGALQLSSRILRDFRNAGFVVNMEKSMLVPS
jgi:hypothetical protein